MELRCYITLATGNASRIGLARIRRSRRILQGSCRIDTLIESRGCSRTRKQRWHSVNIVQKNGLTTLEHNDTEHNGTERTLRKMILSIIILGLATLRTMTVNVMNISITTFSITELSIMPLSIMTFSMTTLIMMTLSMTTLSIMSLGILGYIIRYISLNLPCLRPSL
jgi:hypothetical protein